MKTFNINGFIKVKLTEHGYNAHVLHYKKYLGGNFNFTYCLPRVDEDGFTEYQLWEFMNIFGEHMCMGEDQLIEDNLIYFTKEDNTMSGGSLNYFYCDLEEHMGDLGDRELDDLVKDLATLFHDREWYLSGDTNEGTWNEAREAFKKKWFTVHGRQERIEKYLDSFREEVLQTFGITNKYCMNCKHWTPEKGDDQRYGDCDITKGCMMHRKETCEKFEERGKDA